MTWKVCAAGALLAAVIPDPAHAQGTPDGYSCSATAFSGIIAGIYGVGVGKVTLETDAAYRPTTGVFTYQVSDRVTGSGRMTATWALPGDGRGELGEFRSLFLPLGRSFPVGSASITLFLDESASQTVALTPGRLQIGSDGMFNGVRLWRNDVAALPDPVGSRVLRYSVTDGNGAELASDMFLLPDWSEVRRPIRSATGKARSLLRKKDCDPFHVVEEARPIPPTAAR